VIAGDRGNFGPGMEQAAQGRVEELDRIGGWYGSVVEIARDDNEINLLGAHHIDEPIDEECLLIEQTVVAEGPAQVPIAGVQNSHASKVRPGCDSLSCQKNPQKSASFC